MADSNPLGAALEIEVKENNVSQELPCRAVCFHKLPSSESLEFSAQRSAAQRWLVGLAKKCCGELEICFDRVRQWLTVASRRLNSQGTKVLWVFVRVD